MENNAKALPKNVLVSEDMALEDIAALPEEIAVNYLRGKGRNVLESIELLESGLCGATTSEQLQKKYDELNRINGLINSIQGCNPEQQSTGPAVLEKAIDNRSSK